jgi:DNA-binding CsgD family transcriptional regulator
VSALTSSDQRGDGRAIECALIELLELERELLELRYVRRADALERAGEAVRRVGDVTTAEGLLARAASELGSCSDFDRVLLSEVDGGRLRPVALWSRSETVNPDEILTALRETPVVLEYPLLEYEVARDRTARLVNVSRAAARTPRRLAERLGWSAYVVAALSAGGDTIGLLHADCGARRATDAVDLEVVDAYADGLSGAFERAVLRHTLALHRAELSSAVQWMGERVERLSDLAGRSASPGSGPARPSTAETRLLDALTPRELEVLGLLTRGLTNLAIAKQLVVREGTIKYHVKNILRKLGATSRAGAVSRFVRATAEASDR